MPTYKSNLTLFTRRCGRVLTTFVNKREDRRIDPDGNSVPTGVRLNITDRIDLLDLKESIETILEDCKDDGY